MMAIKVTIQDKEARVLVNKKLPQLPDTVANAAFEYAKKLAKSIRLQLISQTKKAPRTNMASRIYARRLNKNQSVVMMPQRAIWLDSMRPHRVALKRGRLITKWAQLYFKGGGIPPRRLPKVLFVHPDPYIQKAMNRVRNKLGLIIRGRVRHLLLS